MPKLLSLLPAACLFVGPARADEPLTFTVAPRATIVERDGITGGGTPVAAGKRVLLFYPNHPDDFGGSAGTGASESHDSGASWSQQPDDWPLPKMVDLWADRLRNGDLLAFGIRWVPDPKKRGEATASDVPADAYAIAVSSDDGRTWTADRAVIECPAEIGVVARPLPHILEDEAGALLMPAYAWGKHGTRAVLLKSTDRGRRWTASSTITTAAAVVQAGVPVGTPWLETTVAATRDGSLLAVVRTGSNAAAALVAMRSTDGGRTWSSPQRLVAGSAGRPVAGKLPTLQLLPGGVLALLTAHTRNHCRILASADGTGRSWSEPHILTSASGGNAGMTVAGPDTLLVTTPANRRLDAWRVTITAAAIPKADLAAPTDAVFADGVLTWSPSAGAAAYRVTPGLVRPPAGAVEAEIYPHAAIQTRDAATRLDLRRQLLLGGTYVFDVAAVDRRGRVSAAVRSREAVYGPTAAAGR